MKRIHIGNPTVDEERAEFSITSSRTIRRFLNDDTFWVKYNESIEGCPNGVLAVPAVMTLAPVAWAAGATISIEEIGATFRRSLSELFAAYQEQYPSIFTERVDPVRYTRKKDYEVDDNSSTSSSSMLFTSGVDSLTAYLKHREENPALFTVHGSDVGLEYDKEWQRIRTSVKSFADSEDVFLHTVKSNFREIISYDILGHHFMSDIDRGWWGAVHYGTGLPALCAPIAYNYEYNFVYQGSGYTRDPDYPTAQPGFVHCLRWGDTEARITEVEMSRQEKIKYISENLDDFNGLTTIRSCYSDNASKNCSECEKCRRTMIGLCIEGINPNTVGYSMDQDTLVSIRRDLEGGNMTIEGYRLYFWQDLQDRANERKSIYMGDADFFDWFRSVEFTRFAIEERKQKRLENILTGYPQNVILSMPYPIDVYLWSIAKPIKKLLF